MGHPAFDTIRAAAPAVLPSLLQCDFGDLRREVDQLNAVGSEVLHLDVMDGNFVPNLTYGMPIVAGLKKHTDMPLDVHLMINDPLQYAKPMVDAGADLLTFHVEAVDDVIATAGQIRDLGVPAGVAVNPDTPMDAIMAAAAHVDMVLVMSVNAGFGGQSFRPEALDRLRMLRAAYPDLLLEIDGGIKKSNIASAREAGCDLFVVGSAIFGADDYGSAIDGLNTEIQNASERGRSETGEGSP
ncbi:MAG: ribulose-phosphate 3-epimerase [Planctomycetota bacterium]